MPQTCKALIKDYCANCTFAGIHFIADDTKHWIERLVWLVLVILSWYGSAVLVIAAWEAFVLNPISFGVETTYTEWNTEMPTIAICETSNNEKLFDVADTIWTPDHLLDLEDALKDIAFYRGVSYSLVELCYLTSNPDPLCPASNFSYYANLVRSSCPQFVKNCSYNDKPFICCEHFQPIDTDLGTCFIINTIQVRDPKPLPMVSNMKNKRGIIRFELTIQSTVYTIGQEEIPSVTTIQSSALKVALGHKYRRHIAVRNIENDPLVMQTSIEQRACKFYDENDEGLYPYYSYSACTTRCRKRAQIQACGCNDHFMVGATEPERCNISGMACLHGLSSHLTTLKPAWANRQGLVCDCLPSCNETEITIIKDAVIHNRANKKKADVEVVLAYLPTERFKRNVVRSRLDLVVSIGSTAGLFVGASLLSFVELIFYFTVRFVSNIWMDRQKRRSNTATAGKQPRILNVERITIRREKIQHEPYANSGVTTFKFFNHIMRKQTAPPDGLHPKKLRPNETGTRLPRVEEEGRRQHASLDHIKPTMVMFFRN